MSTVLIPTFNRPEFLQLNLKHIMACPEAQAKELDIRVYLDRSPVSPAFDDVKQITRQFGVRLFCRSNHNFHGNTFNVLEAYKEASGNVTDGEFIFLVEEDVLVTADFFKWHYAIQAKEDLFASVAHRNLHRDDRSITNPGAYQLSYREYCSLGVCFKREKLMPVLQHAKPEYYRALQPYVTKTFPNSRLANIWSEQDGLIRRIQEQTHGAVAFPYVPRAVHLGWYGYNRDGNVPRPQGKTTAERVEWLRPVIVDQERLSRLEQTYNDVEAVAPVPAWASEDLVCVNRFEE